MNAAARDVAAALQALARAARSVLLYDAANATVGQHVAEYRAKMRLALEAHGGMAIVVRPFELVAGDAVVYQDADREKSFAFRLYRDGVRELRFEAGATWPELLLFLEIMAVRYTGVRQQEEDTVTLLRKADFRTIAVRYVEGFTPAEELPEPRAEAGIERSRRRAPPPGWDTPLAPLAAPAPLAHVRLPDAALAAVRADAEGGEVSELALAVVRELVQDVLSSERPVAGADLTPFLDELREGLLALGDFAALRRLVDVLGGCGAIELRDATLRALAGPRTLERLLSIVPEGCDVPAPDVVGFVPLLGMESLLDRFAAEARDVRRRLLLRMIECRLPRDADPVVARLPRLAPAAAKDVAGALVRRVPERGLDVARHLAARDEEALRCVAASALGAIPGEVPLAPLLALFDDPSEAVRLQAIEVVGRRGEASAIAPLRARLEGGLAASRAEVEALACALAGVAPLRAAALFAPWLRPSARFLRGVSAAQRTLQWAAIAGMGRIPGDDADATLRALAEASDEDVRRHCLATLTRRRREAAHGAR